MFWKTLRAPGGRDSAAQGQWPLLPEEAVPTPQTGPKEPRGHGGRGSPPLCKAALASPAHVLGFKGCPH